MGLFKFLLFFSLPAKKPGFIDIQFMLLFILFYIPIYIIYIYDRMEGQYLCLDAKSEYRQVLFQWKYGDLFDR